MPAPRLQSVPLNKKRGAWGGCKALEVGPPSPTSTGMACLRWWLLGGHREGRPCWRAGSPDMGEGRGHGPVGRGCGGAGLLRLVGKASPLSGPSLSWGVSKEGPHGQGLATVWLAGDETSPNQNQRGTEGGWGEGGHGRNTKPHGPACRAGPRGKARRRPQKTSPVPS